MNAFQKLASIMAAALVGTVLGVAPQASAAVSNGYDLTASLAAGSRGVTVLSSDSDKAEVAVNAVVALTTSDTLAATANDYVSLEISGPASWTDYTAAGSNPTGVTLTNLGKLFTFTATTTSAVNLPTNIKLTVNDAGTVTVTQKKSVSGTVSTIDVKTIYATSTAKTDVFSASGSFARVQADGTAGTLATSVDVAGSTTVVNDGTGYVNVLAKDGYGDTMSTSGVIQANATGGAIIAWDGSPTTQVSSAAKTGTGGVLYVKQGTANANKPVTTTITVSFNGTVFATKTIGFTGVPASIVVSGVDIAQSGGARTGTYDFVVKDSAGNQLAGITPTADSTYYTSQVTAVSVGGASSATAVQTGGWTCAATSGSAPQRLKYTASDLSVIYSDVFTAACGQGVNKYTAKLDKSSYKPGEIATLTISATDISGAKVHDAATVGANVSVSVGGMTAVAAPTAADTFTNGDKTYKFTVGNNAGSYNAVVDLPAYVATDSAKTVAYTITTDAVSNADVLKGIVALIDVLSKQLLELQKQVAATTTKTTITCVKGTATKKVTGVAPKCPVGYKKK